jgi:hypothetical protein
LIEYSTAVFRQAQRRAAPKGEGSAGERKSEKPELETVTS